MNDENDFSIIFSYIETKWELDDSLFDAVSNGEIILKFFHALLKCIKIFPIHSSTFHIVVLWLTI